MSYSGCYDDHDAEEDEELEMYGLRNDDDEENDNSDEERDAIEQAMFMRIHYAATVEDEDKASDGEETTLTSHSQRGGSTVNEEGDTTATNQSREDEGTPIIEDSNKIVISFNPLPTVENVVEKETSIEESYNSSDEGNKQGDLMRISLNDSGVLVVTDKSDDELISKYSLKKTSSILTSEGSLDKSVIVLDTSTSDAIVLTSDGCNTTVNVDSSSDSDSDCCVIGNPSKPQPELIDLAKSPARRVSPRKATPRTSLVVKINRKSSASISASTDLEHDEQVNGKQRTWKGKDGLPTNSKQTGSSIFEVSSESIMKALQQNTNNPNNFDVTSGGSGGTNLEERPQESSSDSESDCMLVESMSEDGDMDFNFVTPLGMEHSKDSAAVAVDRTKKGSASVFGQPNGPRCMDCFEFGHTARYCPELKPLVPLGKKRQPEKPRQPDNQRQPDNRRQPSRYFQPEPDPDQSDSAKNNKGGPRCMNCYEFGHLARNCTEPKRIPTCILCGEKGHFDLVCPDAICYKCNLPGHRAKECDSKTLAQYAWCQRCQLQGHLTQMCPDSWRQYHLTMEPDQLIRFSQTNKRTMRSQNHVYCCNCGLQGHHAFDCLGQRMDQYTRPMFPHVWLYDEEFGPQVNLSGPPHIKTQKGKRGKNQKIMTYLKNTAPVRKLNHHMANLTTKLTGKKKNSKMKADPSFGGGEPQLTQKQKRKLKLERRQQKRNAKRMKYTLAMQSTREVEQGMLQEYPNNTATQFQVNVKKSRVHYRTMSQEKKQAKHVQWRELQRTRIDEKKKARKQGRVNDYKRKERAKKSEKEQQKAATKAQKKQAKKAKQKQAQKVMQSKQEKVIQFMSHRGFRFGFQEPF